VKGDLSRSFSKKLEKGEKEGTRAAAGGSQTPDSGTLNKIVHLNRKKKTEGKIAASPGLCIGEQRKKGRRKIQ